MLQFGFIYPYWTPKYHFCPYLANVPIFTTIYLYLAVFSLNYPYLGIFALNCPDVTICLVCWSLTSLCHSNGHIETMPAREINPFTALTRIRSQFLRTQWSTSNHQRVDTTTPQTAQPSGLAMLPYVQYSPYIYILLLRLHLCAKFSSNRTIIHGDCISKNWRIQKCRHECSLGVNLVIDNVASDTSPPYKIWKWSDHYLWRYCILKIWGIRVSFGCEHSCSSARSIRFQ